MSVDRNKRPVFLKISDQGGLTCANSQSLNHAGRTVSKILDTDHRRKSQVTHIELSCHDIVRPLCAQSQQLIASPTQNSASVAQEFCTIISGVYCSFGAGHGHPCDSI
jgi:hypothetical protein